VAWTGVKIDWSFVSTLSYAVDLRGIQHSKNFVVNYAYECVAANFLYARRFKKNLLICGSILL